MKILLREGKEVDSLPFRVYTRLDINSLQKYFFSRKGMATEVKGK